jgi:hypothetical protein
VAYRLLNDPCESSVADVASERVNEEGIASMDFGVVMVIANSLLAAFIYIVLNWLWQD